MFKTYEGNLRRYFEKLNSKDQIKFNKDYFDANEWVNANNALIIKKHKSNNGGGEGRQQHSRTSLHKQKNDIQINNQQQDSTIVNDSKTLPVGSSI